MADSVSSTTSSPTLASTPGGVKAWQKLVAHPESQTSLSATDIGWVKRNDSRLNVVSNINKDDKEQDLKFRVMTSGNLSFTTQSDKAIRVQLMNQNGQMIADSDSKSGKLFDNYQSLLTSNLTVQAGTYIIKVTRDASIPPKADLNYAVQVKMGDTFNNDYVTRIAAKQKTSAVSQTLNPVTGLMPAVLSAQNNKGYTFDPAANAAIFDVLSNKG
ncbi:hypothetical protein [Magnetospirillum molischianum]|uniref:Peptidase C-terminal archaeal/bacterial domain-containing protein n=1 Tax=Magnetospirillum molischianum DSM 120 TaxID=1150626 RepID=H8FRP6_MAGML|nr:hypothetical protein [Magnetospirillum molischianum]CCG41034.1 hypothetical protein PHAMO_230026 [Magnetospirillum molischianum DSM 120]